ncbi:glycoside hydrolase family 35 protein, partial [Eubacterium sp.]|uniref:glycoside hydrolase family 35 protein n=1 Tax=Eubacterium sp. TaxID=142586 RepID=UPI003F046B94
MHYFRIPCEYWEDRLLKLKAAGLNTVETYVAWNVHQPTEDEFCFEGQNDVVDFIKTAQKVGLNVILRPGPYICAEWEFGGFPAWLLKYDDIQLRCYSEPYISLVKQYFDVLMPMLVPLQVTHGGPILMMQFENEYGSYGRDKKYLSYLCELMRGNGIDVPLFTSDGEGKYHLSGGGLKDEFKTVNFGSYPVDGFRDIMEYQPDKPLMCSEMWCGWFDHFYEKHHHSSNAYSKMTLTKILNQFFELDASFNFYMFHGGTNFGYMAGANYANVYQPTTTSYDYDAPLNEYGDYTYKYHIIRDILCKKQGINPPLPPRTETQKIGKVELTKSASLAGNIKNIGTHHFDHIPHYMEHYGQNYGLILYHTEIEGNYPDTSI